MRRTLALVFVVAALAATPAARAEEAVGFDGIEGDCASDAWATATTVGPAPTCEWSTDIADGVARVSAEVSTGDDVAGRGDEARAVAYVVRDLDRPSPDAPFTVTATLAISDIVRQTEATPDGLNTVTRMNANLQVVALDGDQELDDWWVGSAIIDPDDEGTLTVSVTDSLPTNATGVRVDVWVSAGAKLGTGLLRTKQVPDNPIWVDPMQGRVIAAFTAELLDLSVTA